MADDRIELEIILDDGKVVKGFGKIKESADDAAKSSEKAFTKSFDGIGSAFKAVGVAAAAAFAAAGLVIGKFVKDGIGEAMAAENALNDLKAAFRAQGADVGSAASRMQEFAAAMQKVTTVADDVILQNAAVLVSVGRLSGEGLERATKAALDLSAGLNMEVGNAFDLVAKAAAGNTGALGRYGIKIDESIPKSMAFAAALERINQAFGGAAESKVNTFAGAVEQLKNRFSDLLESLGNMFVKSPVVIALIKSLADQFLKFTASIESFSSTGDVIGDLIKVFLEFSQMLVKYVVAPMELLYNISKLVINALAWGIQGVIVFVVALGNALVNVVVKPIQWILEGLGKVAGLVKGEYKTALEGASKALQFLPDATKGALEITGAAWVDIAKQVGESKDKLFDFSGSEGMSEFITNLQTIADEAKPVAEEAGRGVAQAMSKGFSEPAVGIAGAFKATLQGLTAEMSAFAAKGITNFKEVGKAMFQSLGNAAGQAFAAFGKALATGENGLQAFLNSLLASMGQMAIQLGTQFMLQGAAYMWAGMPNGGALIAAGAALAAFGGVLSGLGGAKESGGGVATAGGGPVGGSDVAALPETEEADRRPRTEVKVVVNGNILDRRQSGLEIIDILNEAFSANDGRLVSVT